MSYRLPAVRSPLVGICCACAGLLIAGCSQAPTNRPGLERAVAGQFAHLYVRQQTLLDRTGFTVSAVNASAACDRGGPTVPDRGAGDDWTCAITYTSDAGPARAQYELNLATDGCYRAQGPSGTSQHLTLPDGHTVTDPLHAFDGCTRP